MFATQSMELARSKVVVFAMTTTLAPKTLVLLLVEFQLAVILQSLVQETLPALSRLAST
jgi:hypothetical protein